jgi:hypothetical protein
MLLHLDSYDLINVFRQSSTPPDELRRQLMDRNAKLVCSAETIQELVKPNDIDESRRRLDTLTTFPRLYIRAKRELFRREFATALHAFQINATFETHNVGAFVDTWQEVDEPLDQKYGVTKDHLVDIIMPLLKKEPDRFRNAAEDLRALQVNVAYDRANQLNLRSTSPEIFTHSVGATLELLGLHPPRPCGNLINSFAEWLRQRPSICPAWRLMGETYTELAHNKNDKGQKGDPPDFAHLTITPYVDAITLDARVSNYVRIATRRLMQIDPNINYDKRIYRNLSDWLSTGGTGQTEVTQVPKS